MTDLDEDFLTEMLTYIRDFHLGNGAKEREADLLSLLNVYRYRSWSNKRRIGITCNLRNNISNIIKKYRIERKATPMEIIHCLFREIENIILLEEEQRIMNLTENVKLVVFLEDGKIVYRLVKD